MGVVIHLHQHVDVYVEYIIVQDKLSKTSLLKNNCIYPVSVH